jgi:LytR cell envelope-related transcriptional attenuator
MVDLLERIGPYLGIAAFLGLAVLAFLIFQQAREVRRLREWAGRAPERAADAEEATRAAAEARGEEAKEEEQAPPAEPGRLSRWRGRARARLAGGYAELDRRLPVDPRYVLAAAAALIVAAGVLTSGFGAFGGNGGASEGGRSDKKLKVAVLNGTQTESDAGVPIPAVQGLAAEVADKVIKGGRFHPAKEADAANGLDETTIYFEPGHEADAKALAKHVDRKLGETPVTPMIREVRERSGKARVAIVIGLDDEDFGNPSGG